MGKKLELSEAERERRRELAKKLREEGKFGGNQKGSGRPKEKRAAEVVAEAVREDADRIVAALRAAMKSDAPSIKLKAALAMLDIEAKEAQLQLKEEKQAYENMSRDKLLELLGERFRQLEESGINVQELIMGRAREVVRERTGDSVENSRRALPSGEKQN